MPEADHNALRRQLLQELEGLDAEQRKLDLRDEDAIVQCQRKIDRLRERISDLGPAHQIGESPPAKPDSSA